MFFLENIEKTVKYFFLFYVLQKVAVGQLFCKFDIPILVFS